MTKNFKTIDILSVITGRLLGEMDGIYSVISHLTGSSVMTHSIPNLMKPCARAIREQLPKVEWDRLAEGVAAKTKIARGFSENRDAKAYLAEHVPQVVRAAGCPESMPLSEMPDAAFFVRDPIEEIEEMAPGKALIFRT